MASSFMQNFLTKNFENSTNWTGDLKAICQQQTEWRWRLLLPWLPGSLVPWVLVIGLGQWNYSNYLEKDFTVRCRQAKQQQEQEPEHEKEQPKMAQTTAAVTAWQQSNGFSTILLSRNLIQSPNMKLPCGTLRNSNRQLTAGRLLAAWCLLRPQVPSPGCSLLLMSAFTYSCCSCFSCYYCCCCCCWRQL